VLDIGLYPLVKEYFGILIPEVVSVRLDNFSPDYTLDQGSWRFFMSSRKTLVPFVLVFLVLLLVSCSGGQYTVNDAVTPQVTQERETQSEAGHYILAFVTISIDPEDDSWEVVPLRQVAGHWNVLKWLEQTPCTDCVEILGVAPGTNGSKIWTVQISHPFAAPTLTGFDVRGIAMFNGSHTFPESGLTTPDMNEGDGELINADGYTTLYNSSTLGSGPGGLQGYLKGKYGSPAAPDATLNGYRRHVSYNGDDRNAFFAGDSVYMEYEIKMPTNGFYFNYCVDASWAPATTKPVTDPITDFPPEANCPEPWNLFIKDDPVDNGLTAGGGQSVLGIRIYDWQGKDSYSVPVVECPELFDGIVNAAWVSDASAYSNYEATIENSNLAGVGEYEVLISVEDKDNASAAEWLDLTAYQIYTVEVSEFVNDPPVAGAIQLLTVTRPWFDVGFSDDSSDAQGKDDIADYEWDFSYVESEGFHIDSIDENPTWQFPGPGLYEIQHRVRDQSGETDMLNEPLEITAERFGMGLTMGGSSLDGCSDMLVTPIAEIYILGETEGTIDLDPGTGSDNYTSKGGSDFILAKLDSEGNQLWGHGWGAGDDDVGYAVTESGSGNILVVGSFTGTVDFDPGSGTSEKTSNGAKQDAFLLSLNSGGFFDSVTTWGGTSWEGATAVGTDGSNSIYVAGYFYGTVDFDPDGAGMERTSHGGSDVFLMKYGLGGSVQWVVTFGGIENDWPWDIAVDQMGMVAVGGYCQGTVDFDAGIGEAEYTSAGDWDAFVVKYDPTGNYMWSGAWGGANKDQVLGVALTPFGNVCATGSFIGYVDFDPAVSSDYHTATGSVSDAFLTMFSALGVYQWANTWGGPNVQDFSRGIMVRSSGAFVADIFLTGQFNGTVDFDPTLEVDEYTSAGLADAYVCKYGASGEYLWTSTFGGENIEEGVAIGADDLGFIYAAGRYLGTTDLDPSPGIEPFPSLGSYDIYINKLFEDGYW